MASKRSSIEEISEEEEEEVVEEEIPVNGLETRSGNVYGSKDTVTALIHNNNPNENKDKLENGSSPKKTSNTTEATSTKKSHIKALQLKIERLKLEEELEEELAKLQPREEDIIESIEDEEPIVETTTLTEPQTSQQMSMFKFMEEMIRQQHQSALTLSLPSTEVPVFDGDPVDYLPFISAFENIIEKKTIDNSSRLYYLIQYTTGEVKEVLQSCIPMNPAEGYKEARKLLKDRYGQNYKIASANVERLIKGPAIKSEDGKGLMKLATKLITCKNTLKEIFIYISKIENPDTLRQMLERLPFDIRRRWRTIADSITVGKDREIRIEDLVEFVEKEARVATHPIFGDLSNRRIPGPSSDGGVFPRKKSSFLTQVGSSCSLCGSRHQLEDCQQFKQMNLNERQRNVMNKGLCFNCLSHGHRSRNCTIKTKCKECNRHHHTLLHQADRDYNNLTRYRNQDTNPPTVKNAFSRSRINKSLIGLPIVPVKIKTNDMKEPYIIVNALLDNGSNTTFCTERLLKRLGKTSKPTTISLTTISKENSLTKSSISSLQIYDMDELYMIDLPTVLSRPSIPVSREDVPTQQDIKRWPHLHGIRLPNVEADVELLIGNDNILALEPKEIKASEDGGPYAVRTNLGWAINGPIGRTTNGRVVSNFVRCDNKLSQQFQEFCNREFNDSMIEINKEMSQEDKKALRIMEDSIKKKEDKHYEIGLPWRDYPPKLPDNKHLADHRLNLLRRKLLSDPNLFVKYAEFIDDLLKNGYAERLPENHTRQVPDWYLPHHAVFNPQKPNKTRVVFDCSAKLKNTSLNDCLLQGPNLTSSLVGVLTRFRQDRIALVGDIKAMFHQVTVPEEHRNALRFLWWPKNDLYSEPITYRMTVHLFGAVSSPSCCNFALRQIAEDADVRRDIQDCIRRNFYVDDFLRSFKDTEHAKMVGKELSQVLQNGGFQLTKWISNSQEVLNNISESKNTVKEHQDYLFEDSQVERTLGIRWNVQTDTFGFNISIKPRPSTRRGLLSIISSIFDPLGFLSPCILPAKKILQDLCRLHYNWDSPIPDEYQQKWNSWLIKLPKLSKFRIKRCFLPEDFGEITSYQLHHMSDASEIGYGSATYLRMTNTIGEIHVAFLIGKSRLTPLKKITIPRLELSAATVSVRLDKMMRQELDLSIERSVFWTDSTAVLKYINNETKRFHTFVANRIEAIRDGSDPSNWYYVESKSNPSDDASRGLTSDEFIHNQRWILGPGFLYLPEDQWPTQPNSITDEFDPEIKIETKSNMAINNGPSFIDELSSRFSSFFRLRRCVAYILRYKKNLRNVQKLKDKRMEPSIQPLSLEELKNAENEIIKKTQEVWFPLEYETLTEKTTNGIKKSSSIIKLDPVLFEDKLIRVGGRLRNSKYSTDFKHPIILPKKHHLSDLIIRHYHHLSGHSGREYVLSLMRRRYWIINANSEVRRLISRCFSCRKRQATPAQQRLADLPEDRITGEKPPFTFVGVDFFGPFMVKRGRTEYKRYGCIFTCLTVRAIHIEITHSMDTDSFINALRRFISRRGSPEEIRSDNGSNFVGGSKELKSSIAEWNKLSIHNYLLQREIKWIFNTPAASHHGGVWERCIRTIRKILHAITTEQILNDEGLLTLMCEVESIINGRPITSVSDDVNDLEALTPNHMLLMKSPTLPPGVFNEKDNYVRKRWKQIQYLADIFWTRWKGEYLPLLQQRQKWFKSKVNLKIGDIILLVNETTPRHTWPLARVIDVKPGEDGVVRTVRVKTKTSTLDRPITKCILLESSD